MRPYVLHGHERPVTQVQFSVDGELLFTSGKDKNMNVWDAETGELLGTYDHKSAIYGFDVTRDTRFLATSAADGIRIFKVESGELILHHEMKAIVRSIEWDHDPEGQTRLLTANDNFKDIVPQAVTIWGFDEENRKLIKESEVVDGFGGKLSQAVWGPFDLELIVLDDCGSITIYDAETGEQTNFIDAAHLASIKRGHFSHDYRMFVTAGEDMRVKLWNPLTWTEIATFVSDRNINDAGVHPFYRGGKLNASRIPKSKQEGEVEFIKQHLIAGGGQKASEVTTTGAQEGRFEALVFHFVQGEELGRVRGHFGPINSIAWHPSGTGYVSGGEDGYVRLHKFDESYFTDSYWGDE
jgi:translation initiation factor 3 subunit I